MMFTASEWTSFPDQDPETSDNIKLSDTFLSEFNVNDCEQVDQFLDGDRFIKYESYINWGLWVRFKVIDFIHSFGFTQLNPRKGIGWYNPERLLKSDEFRFVTLEPNHQVQLIPRRRVQGWWGPTVGLKRKVESCGGVF